MAASASGEPGRPGSGVPESVPSGSASTVRNLMPKNVASGATMEGRTSPATLGFSAFLGPWCLEGNGAASRTGMRSGSGERPRNLIINGRR